MEKEFVSYELSLALKEIGYQSPSPIGGYRGGAIFYYDKGSELFYDGLPMYSSSYHEGQIIAPLYSQAFRWFREKHFIHSNIIWLDETKSWAISINKMKYYKNIKDKYRSYLSFSTYEEAQLECLEKLIEIVGKKVASVE